MIPDLIPAVDAAGLPGPVWLFQFLLIFTFFLHLLFMNLTLGGTLLAAVSHTLAGGRGDDPRGVLAKRLIGINGYGISMTITTGVAPLLFIQLLYHQFFYTATILIGGMWLSLLLLLTIGYYAVYLYKFKGAPARGHGGGAWLWTAAILFMVIGAIQVAVNLIHMQPGTWQALAANPWAILHDPTFIPRYLHFLLAGVAMSAMVVTWWAVRQSRRGIDPDLNGAIARFAWKWVLWASVLQIADGLWLTMALPKEVLLGLMRGGGATMGPFTVGILFGIGILVMVARCTDPVSRPALVTATLGTTLATMAIMVVTRDQLRSIYMGSSVDLSQFVIRAQWGNFVLFAILLIIGLATVYYMVRRVLGEPAEGPDAA